MNLAETDLQVKVKRRPRGVTFHIEGKSDKTNKDGRQAS